MINYAQGNTAAPRIPYRAESTPPRPTVRLHSPSPLRWHQSMPDHDYPESPTRTLRRPSRDDQHRMSPPSFSLTPKPKEPTPPAPTKSSWKISRKVARSIRRALTYASFLLLLVFIAWKRLHGDKRLTEGLNVSQITARWTGQEVEDRECRFVSTVDAYQRDLRRLRRTHRHHPSHLDLSLHTLTNDSQSLHSHHIFSPTGHLQVSPSPTAPHPIPLLLTLGEKRWEELLNRQSRSLSSAVKEYERRYRRKPPKGFDIWWDFAIDNDLVLPDEYDRINLDLAPFFALPKEEMKRRMEWVESMNETFTLVIQDGRVDIQVCRILMLIYAIG
jgi:beta-1,2-xylosyltransferase